MARTGTWRPLIPLETIVTQACSKLFIIRVGLTSDIDLIFIVFIYFVFNYCILILVTLGKGLGDVPPPVPRLSFVLLNKSYYL